MIADRARSLAGTPSAPLHLVDLGCGVCATLCDLAERLPAVLGWLRMDGGRFGYLVGGSALQQCLARGWIGYDFTVFRRAG